MEKALKFSHFNFILNLRFLFDKVHNILRN